MADTKLKASQRFKVLRHLILYRHITSMEAFTLYRITRLSGRIWELRQTKFGAWPIETEWINHTDEEGNHTRYANYVLA